MHTNLRLLLVGRVIPFYVYSISYVASYIACALTRQRGHDATLGYITNARKYVENRRIMSNLCVRHVSDMTRIHVWRVRAS